MVYSQKTYSFLLPKVCQCATVAHSMSLYQRILLCKESQRVWWSWFDRREYQGLGSLCYQRWGFFRVVMQIRVWVSCLRVEVGYVSIAQYVESLIIFSSACIMGLTYDSSRLLMFLVAGFVFLYFDFGFKTFGFGLFGKHWQKSLIDLLWFRPS